MTWIVNEAIFWLAAALTLGWLLAYLPGRNTVLKGLLLAATYAGAIALGELVVGGYDEHWTFRAFVLVLFYIGLGIRIDLAELRGESKGLRELVDNYRLKDLRVAAGYAAPALLALVGIIQQIYVGDVGEAGRNIVSNLTTFIPNISGNG